MKPAGLLAAPATLGLWAFSTAAAPLSPEDAKGHIGETATVCGEAASAEYKANEQNQPTLLDLGKPYPNAIFTAVIYGENRAKFGTPETSLLRKRICVTGQISNYQGKAETVLTEPSQISALHRVAISAESGVKAADYRGLRRLRMMQEAREWAAELVRLLKSHDLLTRRLRTVPNALRLDHAAPGSLLAIRAGLPDPVVSRGASGQACGPEPSGLGPPRRRSRLLDPNSVAG